MHSLYIYICMFYNLFIHSTCFERYDLSKYVEWTRLLQNKYIYKRVHLVGFVYIITYEAWYTQRQNMLYIVNLQLMGASYDQWEFQIHINFYRNKTVNLNISRFCKRKNLHTFIEL